MKKRILICAALVTIALVAGMVTIGPLKATRAPVQKEMQGHVADDLLEEKKKPRPWTSVNPWVFTLLLIGGVMVSGLIMNALRHYEKTTKWMLTSLLLLLTLLYTLIHFPWLRAEDPDVIVIYVKSTQALKLLALVTYLHILLIQPAAGVWKPSPFLASISFVPGLVIAFSPSRYYLEKLLPANSLSAIYTNGPLRDLYTISLWGFLCAGLFLALLVYMDTAGDARNRAAYQGAALFSFFVGSFIPAAFFSGRLALSVSVEVVSMHLFSFFIAYAASPRPLHDHMLLLSPFMETRKHLFLQKLENPSKILADAHSHFTIANALSELFGCESALNLGGKAAAASAGAMTAFREVDLPPGAVESPPEEELIFTSGPGPEPCEMKEAGVAAFVHIPLGAKERCLVKLGRGVEEMVYSIQDMEDQKLLWHYVYLQLATIYDRELQMELDRLSARKDEKLALLEQEEKRFMEEMEELEELERLAKIRMDEQDRELEHLEGRLRKLKDLYARNEEND